MVVASITGNAMKRGKGGVPSIDLKQQKEQRRELSEVIVEACQDYGIFKVVNHGVPTAVISDLEKHGLDFFAAPPTEKLLLAPSSTSTSTSTSSSPSPFGYGFKNIGSNGDMGNLEYLLLHAAHSSTHPLSLRHAVTAYVGAVKGLASNLLQLMAEGLWVSDTSIFSNLIRDPQSDSLLRLNYYPPLTNPLPSSSSSSAAGDHIGFGEHSDPQILTILRSNDVAGLQIRMPHGLWLPVQPDPSAFYVMVGDALQVLTNGRLRSVKHRAMANKSGSKGRMSIMYFGAPPLNAVISPLKEMVSSMTPSLYMPFTWGEYKRAMRTSRLSDCRLNLFKRPSH
ncbi:hypothetical protein vseg_003323 [Gypsophila vaccaria]